MLFETEAIQPRLDSNSWFPCLSILRGKITSMCHCDLLPRCSLVHLFPLDLKYFYDHDLKEWRLCVCLQSRVTFHFRHHYLVCVCVACARVHMCRSKCKARVFLLYCSPSYCLETGSLTKPELSVNSGTCLYLPTDAKGYRYPHSWHFVCIVGFGFTLILIEYVCPLSHLTGSITLTFLRHILALRKWFSKFCRKPWKQVIWDTALPEKIKVLKEYP